MSKTQELLNSLNSEVITVKAVALYLGSEIRENQEGKFTYQFALLPSDRDKKGGVVSIKHDKKFNLEKNIIYYIEAEASSDRPDNHFGVSIYWLRNLKKLVKVSRLEERDIRNG